MIFEFSIILLFVLVICFFLTRLKFPFQASLVISAFLFKEIFRFWTYDFEFMDVVSQIGIIFLMFSLGLDFSFKKLILIPRFVWFLTLAQVFLTTLLLVPPFSLWHFSAGNSFFIAFMFSFSSTFAAIKILTDRGLIHTTLGEYAVGILLIQDVLMLPASLFINLFWSNSGVSWQIALGFFLVLLKTALFFIFLFLAAKKILPWLLKKIVAAEQHDLLILAIVACSFLIAALAEKINFPLSLGAFAAGAIIGSTSQKHEVFAEIRSIRDLFSILFLISLGFLMSKEFFLGNFFLVMIISLTVIVLKFAVVFFLGIIFKVFPKNAFILATYLSQVSEFAFVLAAIPFYKGQLPEFHFQLILSVVVVTQVVLPVLVVIGENWAKKIKFFNEPKVSFIESLEKEQLSRHVVLCGCGRMGKYILNQLVLEKIPAAVIDFNLKAIESLQLAGLTAFYGDASREEILQAASLAQARTLVVMIPDRFSAEMVIKQAKKINPAIKILARAHAEDDKKYLFALGANHVIYPEFEGAQTAVKKIISI